MPTTTMKKTDPDHGKETPITGIHRLRPSLGGALLALTLLAGSTEAAQPAAAAPAAKTALMGGQVIDGYEGPPIRDGVVLIEGLKQRNQTLHWCPTVSPLYLANYTAQVFPERLDHPLWQEGLPKDIVKDIRDLLRNITHLDYFTLTSRRIPTLQRKFPQLRETGVTLLVGTDSGIPATFGKRAK